jgi:hypothetical protein
VTLEQQLEILVQLGFPLNDGVSDADLLHSWDRDEYETRPYDTLFLMLGSEIEREPWGRRVCDRVWNFDAECIATAMMWIGPLLLGPYFIAPCFNQKRYRLLLYTITIPLTFCYCLWRLA